MALKRRFTVFVGDEDHQPQERIGGHQWGRIMRWLFEHCYSGDELMWTAEKERRGKYFAIVRESWNDKGRQRVVIAQSKQWMWDLDRNPNRIFIRFDKCNRQPVTHKEI